MMHTSSNWRIYSKRRQEKPKIRYPISRRTPWQEIVQKNNNSSLLMSRILRHSLQTQRNPNLNHYTIRRTVTDLASARRSFPYQDVSLRIYTCSRTWWKYQTAIYSLTYTLATIRALCGYSAKCIRMPLSNSYKGRLTRPCLKPSEGYPVKFIRKWLSERAKLITRGSLDQEMRELLRVKCLKP